MEQPAIKPMYSAGSPLADENGKRLAFVVNPELAKIAAEIAANEAIVSFFRHMLGPCPSSSDAADLIIAELQRRKDAMFF